MYIVLESGRHEVRALISIGEDFTVADCPALSYLRNAGRSDKAIYGFHALFKRYAGGGRTKLTTELFHEVDKSTGIWELSKGTTGYFVSSTGLRSS